MRRHLWLQVAVLVSLGSALGIANNLLSPHRIPWTQVYQDLSKIKDSDTTWHPYSWDPPTDSTFQLLNTRAAYPRFLDKSALFVDARPTQDYAAGHIVDALNLPIESDSTEFNPLWQRFIRDVARDTAIITYCSGTECDASLMLARYLRDQGYTHVAIYVGGWNFWTENRFPIAPEKTQ